MINIIMEDNTHFQAESYEDLVRGLKLDMFFPQSPEEYMEGVAYRSELWDGSVVEYNNEEEFIHELLRIGMVKMLWRS